MQDQNIVIIDYGMGNIGSIVNMLKYLGFKSTVSSDKGVISKADKIILPGVGHFDHAMKNIDKLFLRDVINESAFIRKTPFLGICLGMQLMCNSSEEGVLPGLSLIDASVEKFIFPPDFKLKVPHMGWNYIETCKKSRILESLDEKARFYFVHSYYVKCQNETDILTKTTFGINYVSSFEKDNIIGVQFHPEKSHKFGISLFKNFLERY